MSGEEEDSKQFDPTPRRLEKAREEGDAIRSEDIQAALAILGLLIAAGVMGPWALRRLGEAAMLFLGGADRLSLSAGGPVLRAAVAMAGPVVLLLMAPAVLIVLWLIASRGLVFAPSKLVMRLSRLSLTGNFKQKFGRAGLVDFLKKTAKLLLIAAALTLFLQSRADNLFQSLRLEPGQIVLLLGRMVFGFLLLVMALNAVIGALDFLWQRLEFLRRNRMTRKEMTDEMKDSEGDPHMKADRRRRAQEIANRRMLADVPDADVVIVNPTHYAVALKWDRAQGRAPVCVAKGVDEIAARIREAAQGAGVPIRRDPPTARALYAVVDLGQEIRPEHYAAVAAAIRFASAMRLRARKGWR